MLTLNFENQYRFPVSTDSIVEEEAIWERAKKALEDAEFCEALEKSINTQYPGFAVATSGPSWELAAREAVAPLCVKCSEVNLRGTDYCSHRCWRTRDTRS